MGPLGWILLGGGALWLFSQAKADTGSEATINASEIMGGTDGDEYSMIVDAITQRVSPFDQDSVVVYYNNTYDATDPQLVEDVTLAAKESGMKAVAHVFGPTGQGFPYFRHYSRGVLKAEPSVANWDEAVQKISTLEVTPAAGRAGRKVIVQTGRGRKVLVAPRAGRSHKAVRHMKGMQR